MPIKKQTETPVKQGNRGKHRQWIADLVPGESLLIYGEDLDDKTAGKIYQAATRERKRILTSRGPAGLKVWLNPKYHPVEEVVRPKHRLGIEALELRTARKQAQAIDDEASPKDEELKYEYEQ